MGVPSGDEREILRGAGAKREIVPVPVLLANQHVYATTKDEPTCPDGLRQ